MPDRRSDHYTPQNDMDNATNNDETNDSSSDVRIALTFLRGVPHFFIIDSRTGTALVLVPRPNN